MAWTLYLYDETGVTLENTLTESDALPAIDGGFRAVVRNSGDCVSLTFRGRNDILGIRVRQIVQLYYGANPIFWGVITKAPNLASPGAGFDDSSITGDLEEFIAEGGRVLFSNQSSGPRYIEGNWEVADIFREFLTLYGPSQLTGDLTQIANTGSVLTLFYKPSAQMDAVLDEIVNTVDGWVWGVDAQGRVFLKELTGLEQFAATELVDFYFKAVNGEDIATKINIVVAGSPSGRIPDEEVFFNNDPASYNSGGNGESDARLIVDYVPMPIVFSYEHADHATYGAEKTMALPPGIIPFLEPSDAAAISGMTLTDVSGNWTNEANAYDGDATTYASTSQATWTSLRWSYLATGTDPVNNQKIVGFRMVYSAQIGDSAYGFADMRDNPNVRYYQNIIVPETAGTPSATYTANVDYASVAERYYLIRNTYDTDNSLMNTGAIYSVTPYPASFTDTNLDEYFNAETCYVQIDLYATNVTGTARLYHYYPLVVDSTLLTEIAKANVRVPSTMAGDVVVLGYYAPKPVVRVTDLYGTAIGSPPSTDMYESVETIEYIMSPTDGFVTRYTVGNDATSDAGVLLQRYVRDGITNANYSLTMA